MFFLFSFRGCADKLWLGSSEPDRTSRIPADWRVLPEASRNTKGSRHDLTSISSRSFDPCSIFSFHWMFESFSSSTLVGSYILTTKSIFTLIFLRSLQGGIFKALHKSTSALIGRGLLVLLCRCHRFARLRTALRHILIEHSPPTDKEGRECVASAKTCR